MKLKTMVGLSLCCIACLSMVACGNKTPSDKEIIAALTEGRIDVTDALKEGMIDEQWLIDHDMIKVAKDPDKHGPNMGEFSQESLYHGTITNKYFSDYNKGCYLLFFSSDSDDGIQNLKKINEIYDFLHENQIGVLALCDGEISDDVKELAKQLSFPVIPMTDDMENNYGTEILVPSVTKCSSYGVMTTGWMMTLPDDFQEVVQFELDTPTVEIDVNDPYDGVIFE